MMIGIHPIRPEEHGTWLEMRLALWPDAELEELRDEQAEILADMQNNAVFVAA